MMSTATYFIDVDLRGKKVPKCIEQWFSKHIFAIRNEEGCCIIWEHVKVSNYQALSQT